uniref:Uncharacterized protein n=1 Tax=Anguilla anguilla TaxID=7936 RepID=A0A0E9TVL5_ANGAN
MPPNWQNVTDMVLWREIKNSRFGAPSFVPGAR